MKLRNRRSEKKQIIIISVVAIVLAMILIGVIIGAVADNKAKKEQEAYDKTVVGINVASKPNKDVYYIGEEFDPTGLKIQVVTNSFNETYFVEYNEDMTLTGFDSSVAGQQAIIVAYMDYTTVFVVEVKEEPTPVPTLEKIEVYDFITTYSLDEWNTYGPDVAGARIRCIYSDESVEEDIILKKSYIRGYQRVDAPGTTEITVRYSVGGKTLETTVTITITN